MFIHMPTFKKFMKQAFSAGRLTVGDSNGGLFVECGTFIVWLEASTIPNKVKGAIMELTGELPSEGHVFKAGKEGNQYELPWNYAWNVRDDVRKADKRYTVTPIVLDDSRYNSFRFLQQTGTSNVKAISEVFIGMIDHAEIDQENGEGCVQGPYSTEQGDMFYWQTDLCILAVRGSKLYRGLSRMVEKAVATINFEDDYSGLEVDA